MDTKTFRLISGFIISAIVMYVSPARAVPGSLAHVWSQSADLYQQADLGYPYGVSVYSPQDGSPGQVFVNDDQVRAFDYDSGTLLWTYTDHSSAPRVSTRFRDPVSPLAVSPDGKTLYRCGTQGYLEALDTTTGTQTAQSELPDTQDGCWGSVSIGMLPTTTIPEHVYAFLTSGTLVAFDPNNALSISWQKALPGGSPGVLPTIPSPTVVVSHFGVIYTAFAGTLYAYNNAGEALWQTSIPGAHQVTLLSDDWLLVTTTLGDIVRVNPLNGTINASFSLPGSVSIYQPAVVVDDPHPLAFVTGITGATASIYAIDLLSFNLSWNTPVYIGNSSINPAFTPPPSVGNDGIIFFFTDGTPPYQSLVAADPDTGSTVFPLEVLDSVAPTPSYSTDVFAPLTFPAIDSLGHVFFGAAVGGLSSYLTRTDYPAYSPSTVWNQLGGENLLRTFQDTHSVLSAIAGNVRFENANGTMLSGYPSTITVSTDEAGTQVVHQTSTRPTGSFEIYGIAPGNYYLTASASGRSSDTVFLDVSDTTVVHSHDLTLYPLPGDMTVTVRDAFDAAIAGATVSLTRAGQSSPIQSALTATDGTASFTGLSVLDNPYVIQATHDPDYLSATASDSVLSSAVTSVTMTLFAAPGSINGTIVDDQADALANVTISGDMGGSTRFSVLSDASGHYDSGDIPAGAYVLHFSKTHYQTPSDVSVDVSAGLAQGAPPTILSALPGRITGTTASSLGGALTGVHVTGTQASSTIFEVDSSALGVFTSPDLVPGTYSVSFALNGYSTPSTTVQVSPEESVSMGTVLLIPDALPTGMLSGVVREDNGAPISGAWVTGMRGTVVAFSETTDSNGEFISPPLSPASYTLSFSRDGYENHTPVTASVQAGQTTLITDIILTPVVSIGIGSIQLTVTHADHSPAPNIMATLQTATGQHIAYAFTSSGGQIVFTHLDTGSYTIHLDTYDGTSMSTTATLTTAEPDALVSVSLAGATTTTVSGTIMGTVVDQATGEPLPNAEVSLVRNPIPALAPPIPPVQTDADGSFSFTGLMPWDYEIYVVLDGYTQPVYPEIFLSPVADNPSADRQIPLQATPSTSNGGGGGGGGGCFIGSLY